MRSSSCVNCVKSLNFLVRNQDCCTSLVSASADLRSYPKVRQGYRVVVCTAITQFSHISCRDEEKLHTEKPFRLSSKSWMFEVGKAFLFIRFLSSLASDRKRTLSSFFVRMKASAAHSERCTFRRTPMRQSQSTACHRVCSCTHGTFRWNGGSCGCSSLSVNSILFQCPIVPSNKGACRLRCRKSIYCLSA